MFIACASVRVHVCVCAHAHAHSLRTNTHSLRTNTHARIHMEREKERRMERAHERGPGKEGGEESDPLVGPMEPPGLALTLSPPWTEAALHLGRPELRVAVGHTVSLLLDIAEREKNRQLRLDALDALLGLCCNVHNPDTLACFFPGITVTLCKVATGDFKQVCVCGHVCVCVCGHVCVCVVLGGWVRVQR